MRYILRLSLLVLFALPAYSQSNYASLSGIVYDPQQKVLAGSSVQLTSETTGATRSAVTNDLGSFQQPHAIKIPQLNVRDNDAKIFPFDQIVQVIGRQMSFLAKEDIDDEIALAGAFAAGRPEAVEVCGRRFH